MTTPARAGHRAVLYLRLSPHDKNKAHDKPMDLPAQERKLRRDAKRLDLDVVGVEADDHASAWDQDKAKNRPGYMRVLTAITNGDTDYVMAVRQDRFSRLAEMNDALIALCAKRGVRLVQDGNVLDPANDPHAKAMGQIGGVMGELESAVKAQRIRDAREASAAAGRPHPGPRPFGYNEDRTTLHPVEGPAYKELFARAIAGDGMQRIAEDWHRRGITNRNGDRFSASSLRVLLGSPRAIGKRQHRGEIVGDGKWERIVEPDVQQAAIAAVKARRRLRSTEAPTRKARLLSSMVVCAECEQPMRVRYNDHPTYATQYICDKSKSKCCGASIIKAEPVENEVEERLRRVLAQPETLASIERLREEQPDVTGLLGQVETLRDELAVLAQERASGTISHAEWTIIRKGTQSRLDDAEDALAHATETPALLDLSPEKILSEWDGYTLDDKRRVLSTYVEHVAIKSANGDAHKGRIDPDRVVCLWRF